jgi:hypothetical protein
MTTYPSLIKKRMTSFYRSLNEKDRRHYAAIEAMKLGHGGIGYISQVLGCDQKTIRLGIAELESDIDPTDQQRKKGEVVNG